MIQIPGHHAPSFQIVSHQWVYYVAPTPTTPLTMFNENTQSMMLQCYNDKKVAVFIEEQHFSTHYI